QAVRSPFRHVRLAASAGDGARIDAGRVAVARSAARFPLALAGLQADMRRVKRCLPAGSPLFVALARRVFRTAQIGGPVRLEKRPDNVLSTRANEDNALVPVVRRLVGAMLALIAARPIDPATRIAHVQVQRTQQTRLGRTAAGELLEANHPLYGRGHVRQ